MAPGLNQSPAGDVKVRTAALSVVSNSALILLKVIAGTVTGSVAILTEAVHSSIDLVASVVAFISVRKAGEPADEDHRYGHEKLENLAAGIEGILILVGAAVIAFEAIRRLILGGHLQNVGLGIAVVAISLIVNLVVSTVIATHRSDDRVARARRRRGPPAHRCADLGGGPGCARAGRPDRRSVARSGGGADRRRLDRPDRGAAAARVDEGARRRGAPGATRSRRSGEAIEEFAGRGVVGYHELQDPARRVAALHRPARPVRPRHLARGRPPHGARAGRN